MSSIAKKMLERHGWQEGMGLGRNAQGVSTYIKVVRRDPHSATGLGHAADATQAPQATTFAMELDAVYSDISAAGKQKGGRKEADESVNRHHDSQKCKDVRAQKKNSKQKRSRDSSSEAGSRTSTSSSSEDSDSADDHGVDITRMTDEELLRRCGGVRLGRAGRHRFFDGKLRRIEESHRNK